ncbi:hypothetical protein [Pedobacter antarcticus]|uniref:hypothetical protein n=1 Tax=Pedobacter antarcticus TaxID=34086 RepID=UPI00292F8EBD|nr:hypothetical protein [Pedobacter antarcticus]
MELTISQSRSKVEQAADQEVMKNMKLLSFLANSAPDIPPWFEVDIRPKPIIPEPLDEVYGLQSKHTYCSYFRYFCEAEFSWKKYDPFTLDMEDISDSIPPEYKASVEQHQHHINAQNDLLVQWEREYEELRFFRWKVHYAKELLKQLSLTGEK